MDDEQPGLPDEMDVVEGEDGSLVVGAVEEPEEDAESAAEWFGQLVEGLSEASAKALGAEVLQLVEDDRALNEDRSDQQAEAIKRSGVGGKDAPGGAEFQGASRATHPALIEAAISFASRAAIEVAPASGVVKPAVKGSWSAAKAKAAQRKADFLNEVLSPKKCPDFHAVIDQSLMSIVLTGDDYTLVGWSTDEARPTFERVRSDEVSFPAAAASFAGAGRVARRIRLSRVEFDRRVAAGDYVVPEGAELEGRPDADSALSEAAGDAMNRIEDTADDEEAPVILYCAWLRLEVEDDPEGDGEERPYEVIIDTAGSVLSLRRNWRDDDPLSRPIRRMVQWQFLPFDGPRGMGVYDVLSGLQIAATGSLRALLDAAILQNLPQTFYARGVSGQTIQNRAGEAREVDLPTGVDDIRRVIMQMESAGPSPILFQLLSWLTEQMRSVVRTSLDQDSINSDSNVPVGTQLQRVEQAMKVYGAIHARLVRTMAELLDIVYEMCGWYLDSETQISLDGEGTIGPQDFAGPSDIQPAAKPEVFSDMQRMGQMQAVLQMAREAEPGTFDMKAIYRRLMDLMGVPDPEELMPPPAAPDEQHPIGENAFMLLGAKVTALPSQDHIAHLTSHCRFAKSPDFGTNPSFFLQFAPQFLIHAQQHYAMAYAAEVSKMLTGVEESMGVDFEKFLATPEQRPMVEGLMVAMEGNFFEGIAAKLAPFAQDMAAIQQALMASKPDPNASPTDSIAEAEKAKAAATIQAAQIREQGSMQREQLKQQAETQREQAKSAIQIQLEQIQAEADMTIQNIGDQADLNREQLRLRAAAERPAPAPFVQ